MTHPLGYFVSSSNPQQQEVINFLEDIIGSHSEELTTVQRLELIKQSTEVLIKAEIVRQGTDEVKKQLKDERLKEVSKLIYKNLIIAHFPAFIHFLIQRLYAPCKHDVY
jgi:hypothetical protein